MTLGLRSGWLFAFCLACTTTISVYQPDPTPTSPNASPALNGAAVQSASAPRPVVGGSVRIVKSNGAAFAIVSDPDEDVVDVVQLGANPSLVGVVQLQPGDEPNRIVADGAGLAHVVLRGGGAIATIDPSSASLVMRRDVCPAPRGIDYDPASDNLYVACATGELVTLPSAGAVSRTVFLKRDLRDVVVNKSQIFVSVFRTAERLLIDSNGVIAAHDTPPTPSTITQAMSPNVAWRMIRPSLGGGTLMLHQMASNDPLIVVPQQTYYAEGGVISVPASTVDGAQGTELAIEQGIDVAMDEKGNPEFLSFTGAVQIGVASSVYSNDIVSLAPSNTQSPFDPSFGTFQYIAIDDGAAIGVPFKVVQRRAPSAELEIYSSFTSPASAVPLPQKTSHLDTGFDLFHLPTSVGTACMNCHPEGGEDSHTWKFSNATSSFSTTTSAPTIRRTQSLRGLATTAPYHWDGALHDVQAVCDEVFTHRMGGGQVSKVQAGILTHWLAAVPRVPVRADLDPARVAAGKALFESSGCNACHVGGTGTLDANQDIAKIDSLGQAMPLQVPSLYGVADRAPYMHDGCAATLMDRLTNPTCAGANHGSTASLGEEDRTNLSTYLESL